MRPKNNLVDSKPSDSSGDTEAEPDGTQNPVTSLSGARAVIVEDEGLLQMQLSRMLRREGVEVVGTASDGEEAIRVVLDTRPDVVLMDINMPVMNGLEASEQILGQYPVCIVMLTANSGTEYQDRAKEIGTCGYVIKPVTSDTLLPQLLAAFDRFRRPQS